MRFQPSLGVIVPASLVVALQACTAAQPPSSDPVLRTVDSTAVATPLWTTQFRPDIETAGTITPLDAEVDMNGNTFVLAHLCATGDCPNDYFAYEFDANGNFVSSFEVLGGGQEGQAVDKVRVNETGLVAAGNRNFNTPTALIERFDASDAQLFEFTFPGGTAVADLCQDGSTVATASMGSGNTTIVDLDTTGAVQWTVTLAGMSDPVKLRCLGDGSILLAGLAVGQVAMAAQYESDGTQDWTWTGSDTIVPSPSLETIPLSFAVDSNADMFVGADTFGRDVVYALDSSGNLQWTWFSDGPSDTFQSIAASDVVDVAGARGSDFYTASIDGSGNLLWARDDALAGRAASVDIDDADDAFVCGFAPNPTATDVLYSNNGTTLFTFPSTVGALRADVTNGVGRCIGRTNDAAGLAAIGIVAFQVPPPPSSSCGSSTAGTTGSSM